MLRIFSKYTFDNLLAADLSDYSGLSGVNVKALISAQDGSVPSSFEMVLKNNHHKAVFSWNPQLAFIGLSVSKLGLSLEGDEVISSSGQAASMDISTSDYKNMTIELRAFGLQLFASMSMGSLSRTVSLTLPSHPSVDPVVGWKVFINSSQSVPGSSTVVQSLRTSGDGSSTGGIRIEYFTLSATDIANKYVTLSEFASTHVAVNLAQATTQRKGVDFEVIGNILTWEGYGLDLPILTEGMTLRVVYYSGALGFPWFDKVGKKIVGIGGHGVDQNIVVARSP